MSDNKRSIKFRVWDIRRKRMIFGPTDENPNSSWVFNMYESCQNTDYADFLKLMQFTGLYDRSGKEVYEGDVICGSNRKRWIVEWGKAGWCLNNELIADPKYKFAGEEKYSFDRWMEFHPEGRCLVEILGNLYEHPDLIGEKQV